MVMGGNSIRLTYHLDSLLGEPRKNAVGQAF